MKQLKLKASLIFILISVNLFSQTVEYVKKLDKTFGNSATSDLIYTDKIGNNTLIIGNITGNGSAINNYYGGTDIIIFKIDSAKNVVYQFTLGGTSNDEVMNVSKTPDNGYFLTCKSNSIPSGTKTAPLLTTVGGLRDLFVVKLDSALNIQWQKTYDLNDITYSAGVFNPVYNFYYVGTSTGITKLDMAGNFVSTSATGYHLYIDATIFPSGDMIFYGGGTSAKSAIVKITPSGTIDWERNYDDGTGFVGMCTTKGVELLPNGNYMAFIQSRPSNGGPSGDRTAVARCNPGDDDLWCLELTTNGAIVNQYSYGSAGGLMFGTSNSSVVLDVGNSFIVGVGAYGQGLDKTENSNGGSDYWVFRINKTTKLITYDKSWGGSGDEWVRYMSSDSVNLLVGGISDSPNSGDKSEPRVSLAGKDMWFIDAYMCYQPYSPEIVLENGMDSIPLTNDYQRSETCNADTVIINIDNPNSYYIYKWYDISNNFLDTGISYRMDPLLINYSQTTTNSVKVIATDTRGGCIGQTTLITIKYAAILYEPTLANVIPSICRYDSVLLSANVTTYPNATFNWYYNDTIFSNDVTTYSPSLPDLTNEIYLSANDSTCSDFLTPSICTNKIYCESRKKQIIVPTQFVSTPVTNNPNVLYCIDDSTYFNTFFNSSIAYYRWYDDAALINVIGTLPYLGYIVTNTDTLSVVAYNSNGCPSTSKTLVINSNELFPSFITSATSIIEGAALYFQNTSQSKFGIASTQWKFSDGLISPSTNTSHYFYESGLNDVTLTLTDNIGCVKKNKYIGYINVSPCNCNREYNNNLRIYPTLFSNALHIELEYDNTYNISIYDYLGREMLKNVSSSKNIQLNTSSLPNGNYIIFINGDNGFKTVQKIFKF